MTHFLIWRCDVSESLSKRQLECLRMASDLTRLADETSDPVLKAQFLRTAEMWSDQADQDPMNDDAVTRDFDSE